VPDGVGVLLAVSLAVGVPLSESDADTLVVAV